MIVYVILFSQFNINYNDLPQIYRKGSVLVREKEQERVNKEEAIDELSKPKKSKKVTDRYPVIATYHVDIIKDDFWNEHEYIINDVR